MKRFLQIFGAVFFPMITAISATTDMTAKRLMPDTVILNDGRELHGLIVRNDARVLALQQRMMEVEIPKNQIRRIIDQSDSLVYFADIADPGTLPPWRMIVQDFRLDDNIRSFREIPATTIDNGYLRNIPYLSFKINQRVEMNVYGNPEDPVCLEFGIYEKGEKITRFKKIIRAYLAGILTSRQEVEAIYSLPEKGGQIRAGKFTFRITPPDAPDAYGGWWISIYDAARLDKVRVPEDIYRKNTLPFDEVNTSSGVLRKEKLGRFDTFLSGTMKAWQGMIPGLRGFYRNGAGELNLDIPSMKPKQPVASTPR